MNWEQIDASHQRARVHGGWLVKAFERGLYDGYDFRVAMAFVPDPHYQWKI